MSLRFLSLVCLLVWAFTLFSPSVLSQAIQTSENTDDVVRRVRFSGNKVIKDRTLETLVRTKTNREFLGIRGLTLWYFIWNASDGRFGEEPSYLNRQTVAADMERIHLYYESLGYFEVQVDTTITEYRENRVEVSFIINPGKPSRIETISYAGFPDLDAALKRRFFEESILTRGMINDTTFRVNRQYNASLLSTEQERIITFLKNNGYASVERDSVIALVKDDEQDPYLLDVQYRINSGKIYRFGDIHIQLADNNPPANLTQRDTLSGPPFTVDTTQTIYLAKEPEAQSKFELMSNQLLYKPGQVYNHSLYLETVNEFQNLGMLYIQRFGQSSDQVKPDFSREEIPSYFSLETLTKHTISGEFFGMKRYGFGTGFGVDYTNNNVFGKAENLTIGANASFEFVNPSTLEQIDPSATQSSVFRSYELSTDYSVPRINFPFAFLDNRPGFTNAVTHYLLSYSRSDQLLFDINSDIGFNLRYEVNHNQRFSSFLDLIELDLVDTNPSDVFINNLRNQFGADTLDDGTIVDSFEMQRLLEDFNPQVSSVIRYTLRNQRTDFIKRNYGYFNEVAFSIGGNLPYLMDKYIVSPDTLEGTLPSLFQLSDNTLTYSRFFKLSFDYRRYLPVSSTAVFAWRFFGGIAHPYGNSTSIPLNRRFFAGGSNDIRGYAPFQLGPGSLTTNDVRIPGGEIKLAAYTELRQIFIENFIGANWHAAWFMDAGNVWYGPRNDLRNNRQDLEEGIFRANRFYRQIAVSSGLGVRLDWDFVIVRFDFPFRIHDLNAGWFNNKNLYFSFGIGHSF